MRYSRNKRVLEALNTYCKTILQKESIISPQLGCTTMHISKLTGILRNNVSMELNTALKQNLVIKINGKPVLYIDKKLLEERFHVKLSKNIFVNIVELQNYIADSQYTSESSLCEKNITQQTHETMSNIDISTPTTHDIFDSLIGVSDDLSAQSKQARAAILYPPNGLHTLITGPTGSGKTTFANIMYLYAIEMKTLKKNAPFITFNCADYAENTQLLLSHLFGHIKGAFTGAFKETTGLVGQANGGILFLDEIHRLPPEGQEMLFSLIDHGKYRKLGESKSYHNANVLLLAATTENPSSAILKTFFRRIPILITLPALNERPLKTRMKLINHFFQAESKIIKKPLTVSKEVLKILLSYKCSGNIGQLHNDIQVLCANAFIENVLSSNVNNKQNVQINLSQLTDNLKSEFFQSKFNRQELYKVFNFNDVNSITFDGNNDEINNILLNDERPDNDTFYENILETAQSLYKDGTSIDLIKEKINAKLHRQKNNINIQKKVQIDKDILNKIVNADIINIIKNHIANNDDYDINDNKMIYSLALHIELLKARLESGQSIIIPHNNLTSKHPKEFMLAKQICDDVSNLFNINIPNEEISVIATFFYTIKQNKSSNIPIIVICHGRNTATSMAEVVKSLIGNTEIYAIDMPLDAKIDTILTSAIDLAKRIQTDRGILILVDMGSLIDFGNIISSKTSIPVKTINNVSTPLLLEAARRCMMPDITLDTIVQLLGNKLTVGSELYLEHDIALPSSLESIIDTQLLNKIIYVLSDIVTFIDVKKAIISIGDTLSKILAYYNQNMTESIFVKFLFHSICMLERVIRKEPLSYKNCDKLKASHPELFNVIHENITSLEEIYGITIPETEISYLVEMFILVISVDSKNPQNI